uniref:hypothetical protein n=1 Tax=Candidatus Wolbachia massiliensis TaxID=1845000 RepID=UPI0037C06316
MNCLQKAKYHFVEMKKLSSPKNSIEKGRHEGREEGIKIGEEKGEKQAKVAVAKNSLKTGMSIDVISQITGLSHDEIKQLQEEIV